MDEWMKRVVSALQVQLGEMYEVAYLGDYEAAVKRKGDDQAISVSLEEGIHENPLYLVDAELAAGYLLEQFERKERVIMDFMKFQDDYTLMKDHIIFRMVSRSYADSRLCINDPWLDVSIIYELAIEDGDHMYVRLITEDELKLWNVTKEDIGAAAMINTPRILPAQMLIYEDMVLDGERKGTSLEEELQGSEESPVVQVVLTNQKLMNGAGCIFYEDVLKRVADAWQADLLIIPSSVHETILMPDKDGHLSEWEAQDVHHDVLSVELLRENEFLSDSIYRYDRKTQKITIAACGKNQAEGLIS